MGRDWGFTTKFFISTIELLVIMNPFMITEKNKYQWIKQWICDIQIIWKLSYKNLLMIIAFELFEPWTMLILLFLFLALILSIWLTIKPNNFRKFCSCIFKKHDPSLWRASYKISHVFLSICLSVRPSVTHFSQDLLGGFSLFFAWECFAIIYNTEWQSWILENFICCLDSLVKETNLDQKGKI